MTTYGLTVDGLVIKSLDVVREEMNDAWQGEFGASVDVSDASPDGVIIGIVAGVAAEIWEVVEQVAASTSPDDATGAQLEGVCALTGVLREAATESTVTLTLTGTPSTVVPVGNQVSTASTEIPFETTAEGTLVILTAWVNTTAYVVGDRRRNASRCYICRTAGTSAGSGGPTTTAADITDGTVHWRYLGEGTGAVDVAAEATETGPLVAVAFDITTIETPVSGWESVINLLDADVGADEELDADLRVRRELELAEQGSAIVDAIRAELLALDDVVSVAVFYNNTDVPDADGIPAHSVEALVLGGANQEIFDQLLASVAAGIRTHGTTTGSADDSEGTAHVMKFTRPTELEISVDVVLEYDATLYPADGDAQVKLAIVTDGTATSVVGKNATAARVIKACFDVAGVLDVSDVDIDDAPAPPNGTTVQVGTRAIAVWDTSRVTVTSSAGTP